MAKAAGTRRIIIPNLDSPRGDIKPAAGNATQELARNLAEVLKLDGQESSELTPRSRGSWARQVEEEHEATGWTGLPRASKEGIKGGGSSLETADDAAKKSKKKKKKKNKLLSAGEDIPSPSAASARQKLEERSTSQSGEASSILALENSTSGHLELPFLSLKGDTSNDANVANNADRKGRSADVVSSPLGRNKTNNSVWALKRSDSGHHSEEHKAGVSPGGRLPPGSSWQPVGTKDSLYPSSSNQNGDPGWDVPARFENEDLGREVAGPRRSPGEYGAAAPPEATEVCTPPFPDGNWDEPIPVQMSSDWDTGWEVANCRRGKRGEEISVKSPALTNVGQKAKGGRVQQVQSKATEFVQRGVKQRPGECEKVNRGGRSSGDGFQEKGGRPAPRSFPGSSNFGSTRQAPGTQLAWGKPVNKLSNPITNWDSQPLQSSSNVNSGSKVNSAGILGKLLPPERTLSESNSQITGPNGGSISLDVWKGGFPPFPGNGSSVFDDYPASLNSDSQCSDDDLDSDTMSLASFDSEESHKSHTTQRTNKWFRNFFQDLDILTEDQLHEHERQWHCPACHGGVGAIDWYRGLQPLLAHAKTVRSKRVKLHKAFAEVLEEEIRIRGAAPGTHGSGKYGKWRGLGDDNEIKDTLIVWPPMVVVRNTQLEQDEDDKWIGMGNKELLDIFKKHNPVKARHAYGPQGHRGISILIFAESPTGYYNAQRLDKQFYEARRGKENWDFTGKLLFQPGGDRILYGYMATAEDLDIFNKHSKGKQNLKWERKSLQEMVLSPMRKLDEENTKVTILQGKVQREMEASKALKKTMSVMSKKLVMREEELKVIRERAREQHHQQQIEMEDMEMLYKEKIEQLKQEILEKETTLERVHEEYEQEHMQQCQQLEQQASKMPKDKNLSDEQQQHQALVEEEIARHSQLVEMCIKNQEEWEARKVELKKEHHQKMMDFKSQQWEELIKFKQKLDQEMLETMENFKLPLRSK